MPARQRRAVLGDVAHGPGHALVVDLARNLVVRADDVEIALAHRLDQHVDHLVGPPGAVRFRLLLGRQAGMGPARHQQIGVDLAVGRVAQRMLQALGEHLQPGLGDVVGGVAGRTGDTLLGAGIDDRRRCALRDHRRREALHPVDHAPQIGAEHRLPAGIVLERPAAAPAAGIVHQHVDRTEGGIGTLFQRLDRILLADVGDDGDDLALAARRGRSDLHGRRVERSRVEVGDGDLHAEGGKAPGSGQADAIGATGDDGALSRRESGMGGHEKTPRMRGTDS